MKKFNCCCTCIHWKTNFKTQQTGMSLCVKKKTYMSYGEACKQYNKDKKLK